MSFRTTCLVILAIVLATALARSLTRSTLPAADFSFSNGADIKSVDPANVTGQPEGRIIYAIFEGLYRNLPEEEPQPVLNSRDTSPPLPDPQAPRRMIPQPAMAERCDVSPDGRTYVFRIRDTARWSDGSPVTAYDFAWSWKRFLHPETPNQYAYQLTSYVRGAKAFQSGEVNLGDRVEIELLDRRRPSDPFPSGTMLAGVVHSIQKPPEPDVSAWNGLEREKLLAEWRKAWQFEVDVYPTTHAGADPLVSQEVQWSAQPTRRWFTRTVSESRADADNQIAPSSTRLESCAQILPHFDSTVAIRARDDRTFEVVLLQPTSYFLELCGFYVLYPVHRASVEKFGYPDWTRPDNLVCNGPYTMQFRRIRDRIRLHKNPQYWNADQVALETIDAFALSSSTTVLNMYLQGQINWMDDPPQAITSELRQRSDWHGSIRFGTYFYRMNTTKPPLDQVKVRRALHLALDKQEICTSVVRAGEVPAQSLVPPGIRGYAAPQAEVYDVAAAQRLLAEAGYPGGQGFPRLSILYNTNDNHRTIAEVIQQQWSRNLGIDVELQNREWQVYLNDTEQLNYHISRAGWIGDYTDPNTFLDLFVAEGPNNMAGWSHPEYDRILTQAQQEIDSVKRFSLLREAEQILLDELPVLPIYFYASKNLVHPEFEGFVSNLFDVHPLQLLRRRPGK